MKRVVKLLNAMGYETKYQLREEYLGFWIYQEVCPSGLKVHNSWMICDDDIRIICQSYNDMILAEWYDAIDTFREIGDFEVKALIDKRNTDITTYIVHHSGKMI